MFGLLGQRVLWIVVHFAQPKHQHLGRVDVRQILRIGGPAWFVAMQAGAGRHPGRAVDRLSRSTERPANVRRDVVVVAEVRRVLAGVGRLVRFDRIPSWLSSIVIPACFALKHNTAGAGNRIAANRPITMITTKSSTIVKPRRAVFVLRILRLRFGTGTDGTGQTGRGGDGPGGPSYYFFNRRLRKLFNQFNERHEQRNHDKPDRSAQKHDHQRLQQLTSCPARPSLRRRRPCSPPVRPPPAA